MIVIAVLLALVLEWQPDYRGLAAGGRRRALELEARTVEAACLAFQSARGRHPVSLDEMCTAGLLDSPPERPVDAGDEVAILLVPSAPGRRDVASARVVAIDDWNRVDPPGGWGWN